MNDETEARYSIPGTLTAVLSPDGRTVTGWTFTPDAGYAGYFGPSAEYVEGPELALGDEDWTADGAGVWPAIRRDIAASPTSRIKVEWTE